MNLQTYPYASRGQVHPFSYRADSVGDNGVIDQVLRNHDYDLARWEQGRRLLEHHRRCSQLRPSLIVDAGANIGAASVYFQSEFDNVFVFAIEPDEANWTLCELNTRRFEHQINFHGAVAASDGVVRLIDPDMGDWGFRTGSAQTDPGSAPSTLVPSISPRSILAHPAATGKTPLIFKVDIEGGEADLFSGDTGWMNEFALIIIELHDYLMPFSGSSRSFQKALGQHEFDFVHRGENFFLFNRNVLDRPTA
jgi:FkbM family methyltransferase